MAVRRATAAATVAATAAATVASTAAATVAATAAATVAATAAATVAATVRRMASDTGGATATGHLLLASTRCHGKVAVVVALATIGPPAL